MLVDVSKGVLVAVMQAMGPGYELAGCLNLTTSGARLDVEMEFSIC